MNKRKTPIWKIVLAVLFLPFTVMYLLYKLYTSKNISGKQKLVVTVIFFILFICFGALKSTTNGPKITEVHIDDISLYKDESKPITYSFVPEEAKIRKFNFVNYDDSIISIQDNSITGLAEGTTEVVCEVTDKWSNTVQSNTFTVIVSLTEDQIAEQEKIKEQKRAEQEAELALSRNTISDDEALRIKDYCKNTINSILKSPSTAEYPGSFLNPLNDWSMSKKDNLVTVISYVDAQNSFGATIRSEFVIQIQMNDDGSGKSTYVQFDGEVVSGTYQ